MSTSWPGNMRGPRVKTPLLLLLLLLTTLTGTVLCQYEDIVTETPVEAEEIGETEPLPSETSSTSAPTSTDGSLDPVEDASEDPGSGLESRFFNPDAGTEDPVIVDPTSTTLDDGLSPTIILIPVVLVVVIIAVIVCCIVINRRWNKKAGNQDLGREDPYLDGPSTEKVPMPMFEEDVPSVLELEMEELDQWMKKDSETAEDSKQAQA